MTYRPDLSAAQHVARREALTQIGRGGELHDGYHRLMDMLTPTFQEFMLRNRLDGAGFEALVQRIRSLITGFGPSSFREFRRPPTRTRPKAEEHEFLTVIRSSDEEESGRGGYELAGLRILLTRRRIMFSFERNGMFVTRHALERSIERGLASWTGRLAEVEDAMLENLGLALAWRRAFETGVTPSGEMVLPCRGGLILGTMERVEQPRECPSFAVGRSKAKHALAPSPLVVHAPLNGDRRGSHAAGTGRPEGRAREVLQRQRRAAVRHRDVGALADRGKHRDSGCRCARSRPRRPGDRTRRPPVQGGGQRGHRCGQGPSGPAEPGTAPGSDPSRSGRHAKASTRLGARAGGHQRQSLVRTLPQGGP
jgi:hypothetical protein